jgi:hypothetical protein
MRRSVWRNRKDCQWDFPSAKFGAVQELSEGFVLAFHDPVQACSDMFSVNKFGSFSKYESLQEFI